MGARTKDTAFCETLEVFDEAGTSREHRCEILESPTSVTVRLFDLSDIFRVFVAEIREDTYHRLRESQGIRVGFRVFREKLREMLERVKRRDLILSVVSNTAIILERNDFKNITQLELSLLPLDESEVRKYILAAFAEAERTGREVRAENTVLREEMRRKNEGQQQSISQLRQELTGLRESLHAQRRQLSDAEEEKRRNAERAAAAEENAAIHKSQRESVEAEIRSIREKISRADTLEARAQAQDLKVKSVEEDLHKANAIIKRTLEELKEKKNLVMRLQEELDSLHVQKEALEREAARTELLLLEKTEEIRSISELARERKEAVDSLKILNRSLNKRLSSTYRVYSHLYNTGPLSPCGSDEEPETLDTNSSSTAVVPEMKMN